MTTELHSFADITLWRRAVVAAIARSIANAGSQQLVALPGGSTPRTFLPALASEIPCWPDTTVTLTDDRRVPRDDPRSNAGMVRQLLLDTLEGPTTFVPPLTASGEDAADARGLPCRRFDLIVLGLGEDGHIASLFPGSPAVEDGGIDWVSVDRAPDGLARISLPMASLVQAQYLVIPILGNLKRRLVETAIAGAGDMSLPLSQLLKKRNLGETLFLWSP